MRSALARREDDWLDLVADLLADPPSRWPHEQVTRLLVDTFEAPASTYYDRPPGGPVEQGGWPPSYFTRNLEEMRRFGEQRAAIEHPVLRYYPATGDPGPMQVADVPSRFADTRVVAAWRERGRAWGGVPAQLAIPVRGPGPDGHVSYIVGREADYSEEEIALAARLGRLFVGLDRLIATHGRLAEAREHGADDRADNTVDADDLAHELGVTARELAVLELLAHGLTAAAIGHRLGIAERTVQKHLQSLYAKLGVGDRLSAVQRAQADGLIHAPWPPRNTHFPH